MFRRLPDLPAAATVRLTVDGRAVEARLGDMVATALLLAGVDRFRATPGTGAPRGIYCGMGVCFECLVTIDGEGSRQACMAPVRDGMVVGTGGGRRALADEAGA